MAGEARIVRILEPLRRLYIDREGQVDIQKQGQVLACLEYAAGSISTQEMGFNAGFVSGLDEKESLPLASDTTPITIELDISEKHKADYERAYARGYQLAQSNRTGAAALKEAEKASDFLSPELKGFIVKTAVARGIAPQIMMKAIKQYVDSNQETQAKILGGLKNPQPLRPKKNAEEIAKHSQSIQQQQTTAAKKHDQEMKEILNKNKEFMDMAKILREKMIQKKQQEPAVLNAQKSPVQKSPVPVQGVLRRRDGHFNVTEKTGAFNATHKHRDKFNTKTPAKAPELAAPLGFSEKIHEIFSRSMQQEYARAGKNIAQKIHSYGARKDQIHLLDDIREELLNNQVLNAEEKEIVLYHAMKAMLQGLKKEIRVTSLFTKSRLEYILEKDMKVIRDALPSVGNYIVKEVNEIAEKANFKSELLQKFKDLAEHKNTKKGFFKS